MKWILLLLMATYAVVSSQEISNEIKPQLDTSEAEQTTEIQKTTTDAAPTQDGGILLDSDLPSEGPMSRIFYNNGLFRWGMSIFVYVIYMIAVIIVIFAILFEIQHEKELGKEVFKRSVDDGYLQPYYQRIVRSVDTSPTIEVLQKKYNP